MIISIIAGVCFAWWMVYVIQWHKVKREYVRPLTKEEMFANSEKWPPSASGSVVTHTRDYKLVSTFFDIKPFNCVPCLSAWSSFVFWFIPEVVVTPVATLFAAGILGIIIESKMKKI